MTLRSTARDAYRVALDFWGCLRRFVDGKAVNGYDDHMAEVLADREALVEVSEPDAGAVDERLADCGLGGGFAIQIEDGYPEGSVFRSGGQTKQYGPRPRIATRFPSAGPGRLMQIPSAADEPAFTEWLASIDERLAAIQDQLASAAPGACLTPAAAAESPAPPFPEAGAGHPASPLNWCAAEMRQLADILAQCDTAFALSYANDLRRAATEADNERQK